MQYRDSFPALDFKINYNIITVSYNYRTNNQSYYEKQAMQMKAIPLPEDRNVIGKNNSSRRGHPYGC